MITTCQVVPAPMEILMTNRCDVFLQFIQYLTYQITFQMLNPYESRNLSFWLMLGDLLNIPGDATN